MKRQDRTPLRSATIGAITTGRIGLGCMGMTANYDGANSDEAEAIRTLNRAVDEGVTLIDTAEIYGPFSNELLVGKALRTRREEVLIATKFGRVSHRPSDSVSAGGEIGLDSSPSNIRRAVEGSLRRLGTDHIDLYYQHRVDPATPIENVADAVAHLITEGKVRHFGLSEASLDTVRRAHAVQPVTALQNEYSLWTRDPEQGPLEVIRDLGIGLVAYSPLGRGFLTGSITSAEQLSDLDFRTTTPRFAAENFDQNMRIVDAVREVASAVDATPAQVALAWILSKGDDIVVIPGTKRESRLLENLAADVLTLTSEQLARLDALPAPAGDRYGDMSTINGAAAASA